MAVAASRNLVGVACAVGAALCFSVNDVVIKFLSGDYALHQLVLMRSLIGMAVTLGFLVPLEGGYHLLRTRRPGAHMLRGLCVVFANLCFFTALASMPLAEAMAIFFVSPLVITVFSVLFLGETVGPARWAAVAAGFAGVVIILRPGTAAFEPVSLLPLAAAILYATLHVITRRIGGTERASTMAFYIQLTFIAVSGGIGLAVGDGALAGAAHPSVAFLLRAWNWPATGDWWLIVAVGLGSAFGGYLISQAYRLAEAALAAPFEYIAMPLAVFWGVTIWNEWPDGPTWAGMALVIGSGLFVIWRETQRRRPVVAAPAPARSRWR